MRMIAKSLAIIKSMRPLLRKKLLYSDQFVILYLEYLRDLLKGAFFRDLI